MPTEPCKVPSTGKRIPLDNLLDWITEHVYDYGHGLLGGDNWVVDVLPLLNRLREMAGMTDDEMRAAYDWARVRVHGPNVKGGR